MKPIPTVAAVLAVGLSCQPLAAQQRTSGTSGPQDVCARLVAFVQDQGDRVRGTGERITLRQVRRYARIHDRFACRSAVANLYRAGVKVPPHSPARSGDQDRRASAVIAAIFGSAREGPVPGPFSVETLQSAALRSRLLGTVLQVPVLRIPVEALKPVTIPPWYPHRFNRELARGVGRPSRREKRWWRPRALPQTP